MYDTLVDCSGCYEPFSSIYLIRIGATVLSQDEGLDISFLPLDVAQPESITSCVQALQSLGRAVDVLINNAGVYPSGNLLSLDPDTLHSAFAINAFGPLLLAQALVPDMVRQNYGRVVNVSSGYGALADGLGGPAAYALSKAALNAWTIRLAHETPDSVKINAMCPGWVRTRMGGAGATRSPQEAADTALWLATLPATGPDGGFFRDRQQIDW